MNHGEIVALDKPYSPKRTKALKCGSSGSVREYSGGLRFQNNTLGKDAFCAQSSFPDGQPLVQSWCITCWDCRPPRSNEVPDQRELL